MLIRTIAGENKVLRLAVILTTVTLATLFSPTHQTSAAQGQSQLTNPTATHAPRVDRSHARRAYDLVEFWITNGSVDTDPPQASPIRVTGAVAVRVTLRWSGLTVGVGQSLLKPEPPNSLHHPKRQTSPVDLIPATRTATAQALQALSNRVRHTQLRAATAGLTDPKHRPADPTTVTSQIQADLQIALVPQPIELPDNAPPTTVYHRFSPGYHGLRLSHRNAPPDQRSHAWVWPANMLAGNINPQRQLHQILAKIGLDPLKLTLIGKPDGPALERFEVIHLVRPARGLPVTQLIRGNKLLPPTTLSGPTLDGMATRLSRFLLQRQLPDGGMAGTYLPSADRYDPEIATDKDTALALYALSRHNTWLTQHHKSQQLINQSHRVLEKGVLYLTRHLTHDQPGNDDAQDGPMNPVVAALLLMTLSETPALADHKADRDVLARQLLALHNHESHPATFRLPRAPGVNRSAQTLILCALTSYFQRVQDPDLARLIADTQDKLWENTSIKSRLNAQPWLAMLETRLHKNKAPTPTSAVQRWSHVQSVLRSHADMISFAQISSAKRLGPADVVGGISFAPPNPNNAPSPSWHTARWLATRARMLRTPNLTQDQDRLDWLLDCGLAARFLAQLMFDEPSCYYVRNPSEAIGGVRLSLTDNRLTTAATAMTLLAITELQQALDDLAMQSTNDDPATVRPSPPTPETITADGD